MRQKLGTACVAAALGVSLLATTSDAAIEVGVELQGWVNSVGNGNGAASDGKTYTGKYLGELYRSWLNFDLSSVSGPITAASLQIDLARWPEGQTGQHTLKIYDVSTSLAALQNPPPGVSAFADLGSGDLYGSLTGANGTYTVSLSSQAVDDINAAIGSDFRLGFYNYAENLFVSEALYTNAIYDAGSGEVVFPGETKLLLVPEPSSVVIWCMLGLIGGGLAWRRRCRKR